MNRKHNPRLCIELLEDRYCPSLTVQFVSGTLVLSGTPAGTTELTITNSGGLFKVMDGSANLGTYAASNITLNLQHYNESITINLGGGTLTGNLLMNLGLGNQGGGSNVITVDNGTINGSVTATGGSLDETLLLGTSGQGALPLHVRGAVQVTGHVGNILSSVALGEGSSVGGNVTLTNEPAVGIGFNTGATIGGSLSVNARLDGVSLDLSINSTSVINKGLSVVGTPLSTGLGDAVAVSGSATIGGNTSVNLGDGLNLWFMGGTYGGNVTLTGGNGTAPIAGIPENTFELDDGSGGLAIIQGSLTLTAGDSTTALLFAPGASVAGDMSLHLGNANNDLGNGAFGGTFDGTVAGNINIVVGSGNNIATIGVAPGGKLNWQSGNGNDSVTLADETSPDNQVWNVNMRFGTGNDTLALGAGPLNQQLTGFIDMGGPPGGNSFDPTNQLGVNWSILQPFALQNV
jgi:hypothetical protein